MSQLRSVLDDIAADDDHSLTSEELASEIGELLHAAQMVDVIIASKVKRLADRGGHEELGYPSPTAFLTHRGRLSGGHAQQMVARANAAEKSPQSFRAWADGRLSTDQTKYLFALADAVPDEFPEAEHRLVEIVEGLSVKDTAKTVEYWRQSVDGPSELDDETQFARRGLSVSKTMGGMHRVDGWLTPLAGEALQTALHALMPPHRNAETETRTPRQRRHDALEDLCRDWLDHGDTPVVGGEKPNITAITDLPALKGLAGGIHETLDGDIITIGTLQQLVCDCSITRIILDANSEVLDVGRKTRVWSPAQRRAIIARDRHCQAEGCDRDPRWCDIHHTDHWAHQGETNTDKESSYADGTTPNNTSKTETDDTERRGGPFPTTPPRNSGNPERERAILR
jgi:hypothetical protein